MANTLQHKKIELIQWLSTLDDVSIIEKIIQLRKTEARDWWKEISTAEKKSIEKGIADADAGKLKSHSEARKLYGKWL
jgi:predicted transcriptional regulator